MTSNKNHRHMSGGQALVETLESNGISQSISKFVSHKITIAKGSKSVVDSLNITSATAIIMNEISNQSFEG